MGFNSAFEELTSALHVRHPQQSFKPYERVQSPSGLLSKEGIWLRLIKCKKFSVGNDKAITYYKFSFNRNVTSLYLVEPLLPVNVEGVKLREFACNQLNFRIRGGLASSILDFCLSQWPRGIRRGSAAARLLGVRVRVLPMA